jgi:exoribonuclease R
MAAAARRASAVARACVDAVEVELLVGHVGQVFDATVVDRRHHDVVVLLADLPVVVTVAGERTLGERVTVRLDALDPDARRSVFSLLPRRAAPRR